MVRKPKIMIVEDEIIIATSLERQFSNTGYEVCELVDTGEEAITNAKAEMPDVILMDILLKGSINGIDAAKEIRANRDIPIVFMTGIDSERTMQKVKDFKPVDCFKKPIIWENLRFSIDNILQGKDICEPVNIKKKLNILVVDDDIKMCDILERFLSKEGHLVKAVDFSTEAMKLLKEEEFDLVLSDYNMPYVTGYDMAKFLDRLKKRPKIGIITSRDDSFVQKLPEEVKVDFVINKPFDFSELTKKINDVFSTNDS